MVYFLDIKSKYKKKYKTVKIRFLDTNKFGHVDKVPSTVRVPSHIKEKSYIVIETDKGEEMVKVLGNLKYDKNNPSEYKFLRVANKKDRQTFKEHEKEGIKALYLCKYLSEKLGLKMNLLKAYIPLNRSKIIFYYVSENRVDFRELVRELAKRLKMRIEMRQVGVRDGVQILGAVGVCGNVCCCHNFIEEFEPVNVDMISEQNLPPLTAKYTGICGRLMCCLAYEKDNYTMKKELPPVGSFIELDNKFYTIKNYDFIKEVAQLLSEDGIQVAIPLVEFKEKAPKVIRVPEELNPDCTGNCENCGCPAKSMNFNFNSDVLPEEDIEPIEDKEKSEISITLFEENSTVEAVDNREEEVITSEPLPRIEKEELEEINKIEDIFKGEIFTEKEIKEDNKKEIVERGILEEREEEKEEIDEEKVKADFVKTLLGIRKTKEEKSKEDRQNKHHKKHKKKYKKDKKFINFKPKKKKKHHNRNNGNKGSNSSDKNQ